MRSLKQSMVLAGKCLLGWLDPEHNFWVGERRCRGKSSIYRGPILLAFDLRFNEMSCDNIPTLDARKLRPKKVKSKSWIEPWMLWEFVADDGSKVKLCDFASAGVTGTFYRTWLPVKNAPNKVKFSKDNPLRSSRL